MAKPSHAQAREWTLGALAVQGLVHGGSIDGPPPLEPLSTVQVLQGIADLETDYGAGWGQGASTGGVGSNNMGAIQGGILTGNCQPNTPAPTCRPGGGFLHGDTIPQPDGTSKVFVCCYKAYATPQDGMTDLARVMYTNRPSVLEAARKGDLRGVSAALYDTGYYGGFGATRAQRIDGHLAKLRSQVDAQTIALREPNQFAQADPRGRNIVIAAGIGLAIWGYSEGGYS